MNTPLSSESVETPALQLQYGVRTHGACKTTKKSSLKAFLLKLPIILLIYYVILGLVIISPIYTFCVLPGDLKVASMKARDVFPPGRKVQDFCFSAVDGKKLAGWLFTPAHPNGDLVLVSHGNAGNMSNRGTYADELTARGYFVFMYDYRGYGDSEGSRRIESVIEDGISAYDAAVNQLHFSPKHIVLFGESIGSAVSANIATRRKCKALIMLSPFASLPEVARSNPLIALFPSVIFPKPFLSNVEAVKEIDVPILDVCGLKDTLVPPAHSQMIKSANSSVKVVELPNTGHNISFEGPDSKMLREAIHSFLVVEQKSSRRR